jgi:hypothetical protein
VVFEFCDSGTMRCCEGRKMFWLKFCDNFTRHPLPSPLAPA